MQIIFCVLVYHTFSDLAIDYLKEYSKVVNKGFLR